MNYFQNIKCFQNFSSVMQGVLPCGVASLTVSYTL